MPELYSTSLYNDANLVAYYRLSDVNDSKGAFTLTNNGSCTFGAGQFGNCVIPASTSSFLDIADCPFSYTDLGTAFTFNYWVQFNTTLPGITDYVWLRATNGTSIRQFGGGYDYANTRWHFSGYPNNLNNQVDLFYTHTPSLATWYMHTCVYNGTNFVMYLNGSSVGTPIAYTPGAYTLNAKHLYIMGQGGQSGNEKTDDVSFFNRTLTSTEIGNLYSNIIGPFPTHFN